MVDRSQHSKTLLKRRGHGRRQEPLTESKTRTIGIRIVVHRKLLFPKWADADPTSTAYEAQLRRATICNHQTSQYGFHDRNSSASSTIADDSWRLLFLHPHRKNRDCSCFCHSSRCCQPAAKTPRSTVRKFSHPAAQIPRQWHWHSTVPKFCRWMSHWRYSDLFLVRGID